MPKKISSNDAALIAHLKDISTWVSSVQDLDKLLELIIESAARVMQAKAASLLLLDPKTKTLYFQVATGEKGKEVNTALNWDRVLPERSPKPVNPCILPMFEAILVGIKR